MRSSSSRPPPPPLPLLSSLRCHRCAAWSRLPPSCQCSRKALLVVVFGRASSVCRRTIGARRCCLRHCCLRRCCLRSCFNLATCIEMSIIGPYIKSLPSEGFHVYQCGRDSPLRVRFVGNPSVSPSPTLDRNEKVEHYIKVKDPLTYCLKVLGREWCQSLIRLSSDLIGVCISLVNLLIDRPNNNNY
ncbi:hypothetical protein LR48_Vigan02g109100 [Vigna angularis]|uniref:Uncharacterized protein n=1 Tax=Phaseolus angularis TaxID=3914 RepID=A0A0L9TWT1_PHAAN|nr:hypothetical protein LR48_Vigan02g109100 [Vigna angularis]